MAERTVAEDSWPISGASAACVEESAPATPAGERENPQTAFSDPPGPSTQRDSADDSSRRHGLTQRSFRPPGVPEAPRRLAFEFNKFHGGRLHGYPAVSPPYSLLAPPRAGTGCASMCASPAHAPPALSRALWLAQARSSASVRSVKLRAGDSPRRAGTRCRVACRPDPPQGSARGRLGRSRSTPSRGTPPHFCGLSPQAHRPYMWPPGENDGALVAPARGVSAV